MTAVSAAMIASGAFHVIIPVPSVFAATVAPLAVFVSVTGAITVFVLVTSIGAITAMAVIGVSVGIFDIVVGGSSRIEERLDVES